MTHFAQDVKDIWRLAVPYFKQKTQGEIRLWFVGPIRLQERWIAFGLLASIIVLELAFSYIAKLFNTWYNSFYNTLQDKDWVGFKYYMGMFCVIAFFHILISVYKAYINQILQIRWRKSMTDDFVARWLAPAQHYRMRMAAKPVDTTDPSIAHVTGPADNPDQRIAEDVHQFVGNTMVLGIGFFGNAVRLGIFLVVLWNLSISFPMTSFGLSFNIPGYLIWIAVIYAALGTLCTHLIGKPLISLLFHQQRFEANFRFGMARIRENSEQIALLGGEGAERASLFERYGSILANVYAVVRRQKRLGFFTNFFGQFSVIFPFLLLGPAYFFGKATLGTLMQTNSTFSSVQDGLTWFVDAYVQPRQLSRRRAAPRRLRSRHDGKYSRGHVGAPDRDPPQRDVGLRRRGRGGQPSRWEATDGRGVLRAAARRSCSSLRQVRQRQDHIVACLLGDLALRPGARRHSRRHPYSDPATADLSPARHIAAGPRLSRDPRRLPGCASA